MLLRSSLSAVACVPRPETLDNFRGHIDPAWIEDALIATGKASLRRRRLPAEQVIWLVLGMALFRDRCIVEVAESLNIALPGRRGPTVSGSAVAQARARLGEEPMQWLFETCASHWAHKSADRHRWKGLALYMGHNRRRYLFGPCSLTSQDPWDGKRALELGYANVFVMPQGISGWEKAQQPVEVG